MHEALCHPGKEIIGKWKKKQYQVLKKLGMGGTAEVFLVESKLDNKLYAMKISQDSLSLNREYQLLKKFTGIAFVVNVYEMDDFHEKGNVYHYLLLDYIQGEDLKSYTEKKKLKMLTILGIILILLRGLETFHETGYILGDLKLENIMFDQVKRQIKLIDLGGVVEKGGTVKEYTPAYDRAAWRCGMRKAEESYDLFTLTMVLVRLILGEQINPTRQKKEDIIEKIKKTNGNETLTSLIVDMIKSQKYNRKQFAKKINELYNIEKLSLIKQKEIKTDKLVNKIFKFSFVLLILTSLLLLIINK